MPGILRWAVEGCLAWQRQGLGSCAAVEAASGGYRRDMDSAAQYIQEFCLPERDHKTKTAAVFESYKLWATNSGKAAVGASEFKSAMEQAEFRQHHGRDGNYWLHMRLAGDAGREGSEG
jgi:putative DNA primase/helicase